MRNSNRDTDVFECFNPIAIRFPMHMQRKSIILCIEINVFVNRNERIEKNDHEFHMSEE